MSDITLGISGFTFESLRTHEGLVELDQEFLRRLQKHSAARHQQLLAYRNNEDLSPIEVSELLLDSAPIFETMVAELFSVTTEIESQKQQTTSHDPVFNFKKLFVLRRARRRLLKKETLESFTTLDTWLDDCLQQPGVNNNDRELAIANFGLPLLSDAEANAKAIEKLVQWCIHGLTTEEGRAATRGWVSFHLPAGTDYNNLVPLEATPNSNCGSQQIHQKLLRQREGFGLTDPRMNDREVQSEINYCIYCHDHDGDFCSKGFPVKKGEPDQGIKSNPLGVTMTGCPLEEKISEMHSLKKSGYSIAPLAVVMVDNPMCPTTGHRICNDCMKACIYQKQEPVDIPQIETRVLTDVLDLPWGVEIYDLLTRWNPLRNKQWLPRPYNGLKVAIAGMGPAGFTLAHHMLMEGCAVVGFEGLKIEPLPQELLQKPIKYYKELEEDLDSRVMAGFGGVTEYGITVRWDKNFLKLIYLTLMRRRHFQVFGAVRFGGTLTVEDAWDLGIDHFVIAIGAGLPQALPIPHSMARGMRQANDFLMALQLSGAAKHNSLANLQVRLPAVVIGGGLTGIDTATEIQAYYLVQIEKTLERYETLCTAQDEQQLRAQFDEESLSILDEFLGHGKAVRNEKVRAEAAGEEPDLIGLLRQWGGVTVVYRRSINDSPAYTRNHEEITKAMEEGIYYADLLSPEDIKLDQYGHVEALICRQMALEDGKIKAGDDIVELPARAILVATGAKPNVAYEFEHGGTFEKESGHYQTHHLHGDKLESIPVAEHCKADDFGAFTSYHQDDHRVTFLGDVHPVFHGSVVKAVASGLRTYPKIVESFADRIEQNGNDGEYQQFRDKISQLFTARVQNIQRLNKNIIELIVHAPMAAKKFKPGQFFRLQNFERHAIQAGDTLLQTEALAIAGAGVDIDAGTVRLIVFDHGASSRICATLKTGDPVALMGPTGVRTRVDGDPETIVVIGDELAIATLQSIAPAMRQHGHRILYVATLTEANDLFFREELEQHTDAILWCVATGDAITPGREQDCSAVGNPVEALLRYAKGDLMPKSGKQTVSVNDTNRILVFGNSLLSRKVRDACKQKLKPFLDKSPMVTASVNTPMQCMLKGVCSQCLQWQIDPKTGKRLKAVFACSWHNEPIELVDFDNLDERQLQNRVQETLSSLWLDHVLQENDVPRI
jgi:NADPH-dependent glutamate synthase beta subunit-like oxidoreductase/NAD(P)H-flavin reductase